MSGHSKWHNIRLKKGKVDAQRGALFTKLSKEIILAAKSGSPDPEANYRLKMAVEKARENNVPQDNIKRAIARGAGTEPGKEIEEIRYEGYGPAGVAVVVDAATDNRNRTAGELRFLFTKNGGTLGETGSVGWMFEPCGVVVVDPQRRSEDQLTEDVLIDGVIDLEYGEPTEVYTEIASLSGARDALRAKGMKVSGAYLGVRPKTTVAPSGDELHAALNFLDELEENEDVQRVFSNLEFSDSALEALA
ncbi:MAG: YebC/PmpR family DNA-binding transcriptional regulator [Candidatus Eremiobacteraeota bacterium]|nr:YebC/PmpR family DNA-binding transcriptional regulator [Candidatus Eremiobacteraeota bacterium]